MENPGSVSNSFGLNMVTFKDYEELDEKITIASPSSQYEPTPESSLEVLKEVEEQTITQRKRKSVAESRFKQQTLPAWQPIISARTVYPVLLITGILLVPIGVVVFLFSETVQEISLEYTDCISIDDPNNQCSTVIELEAPLPEIGPNANCNCEVNFSLKEDMTGKVYMYYALTNFYQNHRNYVKSRDDNQLLGKIGTLENPAEPTKDCSPYDKSEINGKFIFPCGAMANAMFSDIIDLYHLDPEAYPQTNGEKKVKLIRTGIAWESDKKHKFKNPQGFPPSHEIWNKFTDPPKWRKKLWELDLELESNNGIQNEDFIIWMRNAALPNFKKLYRIIDSSDDSFRDGLPAGDYSLKIDYSFIVKPFRGTKSIVLTTISPLGGKNMVLGVAYLTLAGVYILVAILFLYFYIRYGRGNKIYT